MNYYIIIQNLNMKNIIYFSTCTRSTKIIKCFYNMQVYKRLSYYKYITLKIVTIYARVILNK